MPITITIIAVQGQICSPFSNSVNRMFSLIKNERSVRTAVSYRKTFPTPLPITITCVSSCVCVWSMTRATSNVLLDSTFVCTMDLPLPAFRFSHSFSFFFFFGPFFPFFVLPSFLLFLPFCYFKDPSKSIWVKRSPCAIICCSLFVCFASSRSVHFWHERFLQYIRIYIDTPAHKHMPHFVPVCVCVSSEWLPGICLCVSVHDMGSLQMRATFHLCLRVTKVLLLTVPAL